MDSSLLLAPFFRHLAECSTARWTGRVTKAVGNIVESEGPFCALGEQCEIVGAAGRSYAGEIVGFRGSTVLSMTLAKPDGIRYGDRVTTWGARPSLRVGKGLLGRVIDGAGNVLDGRGS